MPSFYLGPSRMAMSRRVRFYCKQKPSATYFIAEEQESFYKDQTEIVCLAAERFYDFNGKAAAARSLVYIDPACLHRRPCLIGPPAPCFYIALHTKPAGACPHAECLIKTGKKCCFFYFENDIRDVMQRTALAMNQDSLLVRVQDGAGLFGRWCIGRARQPLAKTRASVLALVSDPCPRCDSGRFYDFRIFCA